MRFQLFQHLKTRFNLTIFCLLLLTVFQIPTFAAGVIDTTFGINGTATVDFGAQVSLTKVLMQPDSKIIAGGIISGSSTGQDILLVRLNSNGTLDSTFGTGGKVITTLSNGDDVISDIHLQPDGKILAVGYTPAPSGNSPQDFLVMRYNSNGTLDNSFGVNGTVIINQEIYDTLYAVTVQNDGKIIVAGNFASSSFNRQTAVFRFQANGTRDSDFASNGALYLPFPAEFDSFFDGPYDVTVANSREIFIGYGYGRNRPGTDGDCTGSNYQIIDSDGVYITSVIGNRKCGQGSSFPAPVTVDFLPNGLLVATDLGGTRIGDRYSNVGGTASALLPNGKFLVANGKFGTVKLFAETGFIGKIASIPNVSGSVKIAGLSENNFVVANSSNTEIVFNKFRFITSQATRIADFDLDNKTDFWVYRPNNRNLYCLLSNGETYGRVDIQSQLPISAIKIVPEFDEYYRSGSSSPVTNIISYLDPTNSYWSFPIYNPGPNISFPGSQAGDMPVGGDFNGNFLNDRSYFRPSNGTWYSQNPQAIFQWGISGDKPVPADYDYDGVTDYAVYRPSTGTWWIRRSSDSGVTALQWGNATDIPLTGDFDADGKADFTVYRASEGKWYQYLTTEGVKITQFGLATDSPVPGDYDGDGRHDIAIYRNGNWWLLQSRDGLKVVQWGTTGDVPVSVRYDN